MIELQYNIEYLKYLINRKEFKLQQLTNQANQDHQNGTLSNELIKRLENLSYLVYYLKMQLQKLQDSIIIKYFGF